MGSCCFQCRHQVLFFQYGEPAGYACITSKGNRPHLLEGKRAVRIVDFGGLKKISDPAVKETLLEKCLTVCKSYDNVWITEYVDNPVIELFESRGFVRQDDSALLDGISLTSVSLIA
ncbi:hypothetical protein HHL16_14075 [Pseudoflavitalea sp. G-6-1-2]|uniref:hypothetical protein n=1 Tax=Pseudoflavitalea sp. G-6-1-2 TaxID=2728841 RepID=UPI00146EDBC1|nr:hypothetical protein [Pseudoflavitalea sp. G-6-1-2]NML22012.1 hypothetical protein [Pseudoflavitalea sp. G-6-1-2]